MGGLQSWSGHFGEEDHLLSLPAIELWTTQPVMRHLGAR